MIPLTYGAERFPRDVIGRVGRAVSGRGGRSLGVRPFGADRLQARPFRFVVFVVQPIAFHQSRGQIHGHNVLLVIIPLILIHDESQDR